MKALVTGATGFLGKSLVNRLANDGCQVIAIGRNETVGKSIEKPNVEFRIADIRNLTDLELAFSEVDVVFHCAAISSAWGSYDDFYQTNVEGTRNVLQCATKQGVRRLVYVSSTSVYFRFNDALDIKETDPTGHNFAHAYAKTKYLGEQEVLNCESDKMECVIIRPRGIVGSGDNSIMPRVLRVANKGWFPLVRQGDAVIDLTHVENVTEAMILAVKAHGVQGEIFNISNDEPIQVKELLDKVFIKLGLRVRLIPVPYFLMLNLARVAESVSRAFGLSEPPITKYGVGLVSKSQILNIDKAKTLLGYQPIATIDDAISGYIKSEGAQR